MTAAPELTLSRRQWGANPLELVQGYPAKLEQFVGLVLHHDVITYAPTSSADEIAEHAHAVQRARPDLSTYPDKAPEWPYSFGIAEHPDPDKAWTIEGRGLGRTGAHTAGYNSTRYGVVLFGNYVGRPMTPGMVQAFRDLGAWALAPALAAGVLLEPTYGHRQLAPIGEPTACPGLGAFAAIDRLQPPFLGDDPLALELSTPVQLRKYDPADAELDAFVLEDDTVKAFFEFAHGEAAQAHYWAQRAAGWAHAAAQSSIDVLAAVKAISAPDLGAEALAAALRAVVTPDLLAAALVSMAEHLLSATK